MFCCVISEDISSICITIYHILGNDNLLMLISKDITSNIVLYFSV